jgi:signal transduction histidine kinase
MSGFGRLFSTTAFRLSMVYMLASALFAGGLLLYVGWYAQRLIEKQIGQTLQAQVDGLTNQYRLGGIRRVQNIVDRRSRQPGSFVFLVIGPQGETVAGNIGGVSVADLPLNTEVETTYLRQEEADGVAPAAQRKALVRISALPAGNKLLVGRDLEERERLDDALWQAIWVLIGALLVFGGLGAFLVTRQALARMDAMTATTSKIMAGNLSERLPLAGNGDELDRLALNLNGMLDRIGELMRGMKEVSDNIAHDLRTPLTRLRNSAEQALRSTAKPGDHRAALERVIEESDGLIRTFNALLMIARAEAGSGADAFKDVQLSDLLRDFAEMYEPVAEDAGASFKTDIANNLVVRGSRELLGQVVANLIDNAIKYGRPEDGDTAPLITFGARVKGAEIIVSVADNGPGIPVDKRARAVERFARLDDSRNKPGSGLGLSLASAVAHLHKGHLVLGDNQPGLIVSLHLPIDTA